MKWVEKILRSRLLQHLVFWSISFFILLNNFKTSSAIAPIDLIYTAIFGSFLVVAVYINLLLLIPKFFHRGRHIAYILLLGLLLASITYLYLLWFDILVDWLFGGFYLISYFDYWETMRYVVIFVGLTSLLYFSKSWFLYQKSETKLAQTEKEKIEAELDALKSQINPHFLFNSLNSIYSLVLKKSEYATEALIRLSDTLRYIIYESNDERVNLQKEIEFIQNYINLQELRLSEKDTLDFRVQGVVSSQKIAPLLLIPIIENGFKYGVKGETEASFVSISIKVDQYNIRLQTVNNVGKVDGVEKIKSRGTGLQNLKKRLELIYPNQHHLVIDNRGDKFIVDLKIEL